MNQHIELSIQHNVDMIDALIQTVQGLATRLNWEIPHPEDIVHHIGITTKDESTVSVSFWAEKHTWVVGFRMIQRSVAWEVDIAYYEDGWTEVDQILYLYNRVRELREQGGFGGC